MSKDPQWFISQAPAQWREGDELLAPVRASAACEAAAIVEMLRVACAVEDGRVVISFWSMHRVALRIAEIARAGLDPLDGEDAMAAQQRMTTDSLFPHARSGQGEP